MYDVFVVVVVVVVVYLFIWGETSLSKPILAIGIKFSLYIIKLFVIIDSLVPRSLVQYMCAPY